MKIVHYLESEQQCHYGRYTVGGAIERMRVTCFTVSKQLANLTLSAEFSRPYQTFYDYKDPVKVGAKTKLILAYTVKRVATHDSRPMPGLIVSGDSAVHADSAYIGETMAVDLLDRGVRNYIHEKGNAAKALTEEQQRARRAT